MKLFRTLCVLIGTSALSLPPAVAQLVGVFSGDDLTAFEEQGLTVLAEGRKGLSGAGDYEYDVSSPSAVLASAQYQYWGNGSATAFSFAYTASTRLIEFSVAGLPPVTTNLLAGATFSDLYIRAAAKSTTNVSSTSLSGMTLSVNGGAAQSLIYAPNVSTLTATSFAASGTSAAILKFYDVISPNENFLIQGFSTFTWNTSAPDTEPQRSNLAYQFKVGDFTALPPVPEPSTYGIVGLAMLAGAILWRRRKRA